HNGLVARGGFRQLGNCMMPEVMEAQPSSWAFHLANVGLAFIVGAGFTGVLHVATRRTMDYSCQAAPGGSPIAHWTGRFGLPATFSVGKYVPIRLRGRIK